MDPAARTLIEALLSGELRAVCAEVDGGVGTGREPPGLLLPGAFNPVHQAHWALAAAARKLAPGPAAFELSVVNVDKPPLSAEEVRRRLAQFSGRAPLWLTRLPTFVEKSAAFPGVVFVVGADTAVRIVEPRYYGNSWAGMDVALGAIRERGCRFLVAGRVDAAGRFIGLDDLAIPPAHRELFEAIPESVFRLDISSTQLRRQGWPGPQ